MQQTFEADAVDRSVAATGAFLNADVIKTVKATLEITEEKLESVTTALTNDEAVRAHKRAEAEAAARSVATEALLNADVITHTLK